MANPSRHYWMDLLNVIACFAVVMLHCTTSVFLNTGDLRWHLDVVFQVLFVFAVPVFFMISGANLLGYRKKYDTKTFFIKRFRKVVFALVAASIITYVSFPLVSGIITGAPIKLSVGQFVEGFLHNSICDVYWFFYAIIGLYLATPVFSLVAENKKTLLYAIAVCIATSMVFPLIQRFTPDHNALTLFTYPYLGGWLTYYLLGYYLVHYLPNDIKRLPIACVGAACAAFMIAMTVKTNGDHTVLSGAFAPYDGFYAGAAGLFGLIYSSSVLLLFKRANETVGNSKAYPVIRCLSSLSLGVYAIHMLVINTFDLFVPHSLAWDIALRPFVVFGLSLALAFAGVQIMKLWRRMLKRVRA